jgi:enolase-phosphatase E1
LTIRLADRSLRVVLLDIEGTTTPIAFVHDILFPFARAHLASFLRTHGGDAEVAEVRRRLGREYAEDLARGETVPESAFDSSDAIAPYVTWLMDRDRKSPGLKLLQGQIWEAGYRAGELRGQVYPDVPPAIRRWRAAGLRVAIYSSGSELAQRRLFESTEHGDLTPLLSGFFDTGVGAKVVSDSYGRIAVALDVPPAAILFVSDVTRELTAAREAGVQVVLSLRPGNSPQADAEQFERVESFEELQ